MAPRASKPRFTPYLGTIVITLAACLTVRAAEDELPKVRMTAEAKGTDNAAKQSAVRAAERRVVESILLNDLATEDYTPFKPLIDRCEDYLQSTQILRVESAGDSTQAEIECRVNRRQLLKDAGGLMLSQRSQPPSVLVIAFQTDTGQQRPDLCRKVEESLAKPLRTRKFEVVDNRMLLECLDGTTVLTLLSQHPENAGTFARHGLSDVTVIATITARTEQEKEKPVNKSTSTVSLFVFRGYDGKLAEAISQEAIIHSVNPEEGLSATVENACERFSRELPVCVALASATPKHPGFLSVTLLDTGNKERLDSFLSALNELAPGAQPDVAFYSDKMARVTITYTGSLASLNDGLTARDYAGAALETRAAVANSLTFRFVAP